MSRDGCVPPDRRPASGSSPERTGGRPGPQSSCRCATADNKLSGPPAVSMDGRGPALDNVFIERLWRAVKYEDLYIRGYEEVPELWHGLARYFAFYNHARLHQSLGYRTPAAVYETQRPRGCSGATAGPGQWISLT
jgi:putative transposase